MGRHRILYFGVGFLLALLLYVGTFSYWWLRSPSKDLVIQAQEVHEVQFTFNWFSYHTEHLWLPAFWFMEHALGYEYVGLIAMDEHSVYVYSK